MRIAMTALLLSLCVGTWALELVQVAPAGNMTVTLYPGQTRALVRETRAVPLPAGDSALSFSWTSASVDAGSVTLTLPDAAVADVVRPAGQDKALLWRVNSPQARQVEAVISYFLEGCKWYPAYSLLLAEDRQTATLTGEVHLTNETGAALRDTQVQIAIGSAAMIDEPQEQAEPAAAANAYAVAQPLTMDAGETAARGFLLVDKLPVRWRYLYQVERFGGKVERMLTLSLPPDLRNLPEGSLTVYEAGQEGIPLFRAQLVYQPGEALDIDLGPEPDVVVERKMVNYQRSNVETDRFGRVSGMDTTEDYVVAVRNRTDCDIVLESTEILLSTWELKSLPHVAKIELNTAQFNVPAAAGGDGELKLTFLKHSGTRAK